jgi:uncharacterized protein (DUF2267 family)
MDERAFAAAVAGQAGLTREESADLTRATLDELGGQLSGGETRELAGALPNGLGSHLPRHEHGAHPMPFNEFIWQLARRTGLSRDDVTRGVRAILTILGQAPGSVHLRHALSQLPAEYRRLALA